LDYFRLADQPPRIDQIGCKIAAQAIIARL
jgi:hypothetical protein